jgi:hypothetical protein
VYPVTTVTRYSARRGTKQSSGRGEALVRTSLVPSKGDVAAGGGDGAADHGRTRRGTKSASYCTRNVTYDRHVSTTVATLCAAPAVGSVAWSLGCCLSWREQRHGARLTVVCPRKGAEGSRGAAVPGRCPGSAFGV